MLFFGAGTDFFLSKGFELELADPPDSVPAFALALLLSPSWADEFAHSGMPLVVPAPASTVVFSVTSVLTFLDFLSSSRSNVFARNSSIRWCAFLKLGSSFIADSMRLRQASV